MAASSNAPLVPSFAAVVISSMVSLLSSDDSSLDSSDELSFSDRLFLEKLNYINKAK